MKKITVLASVTLVATLVVIVLTLGDFLALHDIRTEYVSAEILKTLGVRLSDELPDWTATAGEWTLVQFSYLSRSAFLVLNVVTLSIVTVILRKQASEKAQSA